MAIVEAAIKVTPTMMKWGTAMAHGRTTLKGTMPGKSTAITAESTPLGLGRDGRHQGNYEEKKQCELFHNLVLVQNRRHKTGQDFVNSGPRAA
jgi:hypothetical protein